MDKRVKVIEMCRELRLPSIRKMVQDEGLFENPNIACNILHQVLEQEQKTALSVLNKIGFVQLISRRRNY